MKLFIWIAKIRRKGNKQRIKYLLEKLICELKQQGCNLDSVTSSGKIYFTIFEHDDSYHIYGHQAEVRIDKEEKKCQK